MAMARDDRRRRRRVQIEASVTLRRPGHQQAEPVQATTRDVSLAGVYFETEDGKFAVNDSVVTSVAIPPSQTGTFPFKRLAGRSRVVRVNPVGEHSKSDAKRFGIALEFGDDITVLTALPPSA